MLGSCRLKTDLKGYRQVRMLNKHPALGSCSIYIFEPTKSRNPFANKQNKQTRFAKDFKSLDMMQIDHQRAIVSVQ